MVTNNLKYQLGNNDKKQHISNIKKGKITLFLNLWQYFDTVHIISQLKGHNQYEISTKYYTVQSINHGSLSLLKTCLDC